MKYRIILLQLLLVCLSTSVIARGQFVVINAKKIYVDIEGNQNTTTIVFVSGAGEDHTTWNDVQPELSKSTRTFSYDRIGLGKSDSIKLYYKDANAMANELFLVLRAAKVSPPYILVGHSIGCQIARIFASKHSDLVKGILFIDPGFSEDGLKKIMAPQLWQQRADKVKSYMPPGISGAQSAEIKMISLSCDQAEKSHISKSIPVILLTATKISEGFPGAQMETQFKKQSHLDWLKEIPQAKHAFVAQSRHYIQNDAPGIVVEDIKRFID